MKDEDEVKFYALLEKIENLCRSRKELAISEIERMALEQGVRPTAILDELFIIEGMKVDLARGKVTCQ